jgi:peptidoglycan hydrolase-like protein with peptidoglycan-binding domain
MTSVLRRRVALRVAPFLLIAFVTLGGAATPAAAAVPGVNWPVQSLGDRGTDVLTLQRLLRVRLAAPATMIVGRTLVATEVAVALPPADGRFGTSTVAAVKAWQTVRGIPVTGIVDGPTWSTLAMALRAGDSGEAVTALQFALREKRRVTLALDGVFGATTTSAVVSFQKHMGLSATGVMNAATWRALVGHHELPRFRSIQLCDYSVGNGPANWGMAEAIDTLEAVGRSMVAAGYGRVPVGDVSFEHPGDIPGHESHERGLDIDVRPLRLANDQCTWGTRWTFSTYDRAATRAMIKKFRALAPGHIKLVYFNDPVLIREGLTRWYAGHDDHVHVRFCEKIHPLAMYDC